MGNEPHNFSLKMPWSPGNLIHYGIRGMNTSIVTVCLFLFIHIVGAHSQVLLRNINVAATIAVSMARPTVLANELINSEAPNVPLDQGQNNRIINWQKLMLVKNNTELLNKITKENDEIFEKLTKNKLNYNKLNNQIMQNEGAFHSQ